MTEQAKFIEVLENPMQYIKIDSQGLCDVDVTIELWTAMQYAITACKAMEQAGDVLPETRLVEDYLSEYCELYHSAGEAVPQIDFEKMRLTVNIRNEAIDEMRSAFSKLLLENQELKRRLKDDKQRLDFLQEITDKKAYTGKVILRNSTTGRGWRLCETSWSGCVQSVRKAIDNFKGEQT